MSFFCGYTLTGIEIIYSTDIAVTFTQ